MTTIHVVAAVIVRDGRFLLVRKRGTSAFMQVGGKLEPGEDARAALVRECAEEIGLVVDPDAVVPWGRFDAPAANEADHTVVADVFAVELPAGFDPEPRAELAEVVWVDPAAPVTTHPVAALSVDLLERAVRQLRSAPAHRPPDGAPRRPGAPLTPHETALLERICAGTWRGAAEARAQLAHARWGGKDHEGDACFVLDVPTEVGLPRIPPHDGGPIAELEVADGETPLGMLELWVEDGVLHSLDYSTYGDDTVETLPGLHQIVE
ncbi:hypothetical protein GCM10009718_34730 [Isoptericola halotolerans]|uniref:8-oxo-dGTP pyrophosphatase MutT (NUDIX family) n=1 Tax=Isoptericola halotolerans TaxID=300560 RepID=A0ABX2A2S0_9MICO|nr:8-oxo-dGTP pyrophosphatase MutT (NUDIX family) [Isoptericola halotolerans]